MSHLTEQLNTEDASSSPSPQRRLVFVPLVFFLGFVAIALPQLFKGDPSRLPSALIGKEVPSFTLPPIAGHAGLSDSDLKQGHVTLVNVFASWCVPCHVEHAALLALSQNPALAKEGVTLVGIAYKDNPENVRRFLNEAGDPFARVGADTSGDTGIQFGVYGVPETYIVKGDGTVAYKFVGPIDDDAIKGVILEIEKARR